MPGRGIEVRVAQLGAPPPAGKVLFRLVDNPLPPRCVFKIDSRGVSLPWEAMLELGRLFRSKVENAKALANGYVIVLFDGQLVLSVRPDVALRLHNAAVQCARQAEEIVKREQVSEDAAVLIRAGAHLRLATDERVNAMALDKAGNDRDLRRYMPNLRSAVTPLLPNIVQLSPTPEQAEAQRAYDEQKYGRKAASR